MQKNYNKLPPLENLQDRINYELYDYIFATRFLENEDFFEKRYYYFVDLSLLYHDKGQAHYFMPANGVMNKLAQSTRKAPDAEILYLDKLIFDRTLNQVTHDGYLFPGVVLLLEYFWSDKTENLSDDENILLKNLDKTKFLDLYESLKLNGGISFK